MVAVTRLLSVGYSGSGKTSAAICVLKRLKVKKVVILNGPPEAYSRELKQATVEETDWENPELFNMHNVAFVIDDFAVGRKKEELCLRTLVNRTSRHNNCHIFVICHELQRTGLSSFVRFFNTFVLPCRENHDTLLKKLLKGVGGGKDEEISALFKAMCLREGRHYLCLSYSDDTGRLSFEGLNNKMLPVSRGKKRALSVVANQAGEEETCIERQEWTAKLQSKMSAWGKGMFSTPLGECCMRYVLDKLAPHGLVAEDFSVSLLSADDGTVEKFSLFDFAERTTSPKGGGDDETAQRSMQLLLYIQREHPPFPLTLVKNELLRKRMTK